MNPISFANNDIEFQDSTGIDHDRFSFSLKKSLFNFMHGMCFDFELQEWFDFEIPDTTIEADFIMKCLDKPDLMQAKPSSRIIWLGGMPIITPSTKTKKGVKKEFHQLLFHDRTTSFQIELEKEIADWWTNTLNQISKSALAESEALMNYGTLKSMYEAQFTDFELFWYSEPIETLRANGLLVL